MFQHNHKCPSGNSISDEGNEYFNFSVTEMTKKFTVMLNFPSNKKKKKKKNSIAIIVLQVLPRSPAAEAGTHPQTQNKVTKAAVLSWECLEGIHQGSASLLFLFGYPIPFKHTWDTRSALLVCPYTVGKRQGAQGNLAEIAPVNLKGKLGLPLGSVQTWN